MSAIVSYHPFASPKKFLFSTCLPLCAFSFSEVFPVGSPRQYSNVIETKYLADNPNKEVSKDKIADKLTVSF